MKEKAVETDKKVILENLPFVKTLVSKKKIDRKHAFR